jgi:hypothetical protein
MTMLYVIYTNFLNNTYYFLKQCLLIFEPIYSNFVNNKDDANYRLTETQPMVLMDKQNE